LGVGIELNGLVPEKLFGQIAYQDPIRAANEVAYFLKAQKTLRLYNLLSHLGFEYK
jgi:5'-nucleotidase